jgi:hypothetical protein
VEIPDWAGRPPRPPGPPLRDVGGRVAYLVAPALLRLWLNRGMPPERRTSVDEFRQDVRRGPAGSGDIETANALRAVAWMFTAIVSALLFAAMTYVRRGIPSLASFIQVPGAVLVGIAMFAVGAGIRQRCPVDAFVSLGGPGGRCVRPHSTGNTPSQRSRVAVPAIERRPLLCPHLGCMLHDRIVEPDGIESAPSPGRLYQRDLMEPSGIATIGGLVQERRWWLAAEHPGDGPGSQIPEYILCRTGLLAELQVNTCWRQAAGRAGRLWLPGRDATITVPGGRDPVQHRVRGSALTPVSRWRARTRGRSSARCPAARRLRSGCSSIRCSRSPSGCMSRP